MMNRPSGGVNSRGSTGVSSGAPYLATYSCCTAATSCWPTGPSYGSSRRSRSLTASTVGRDRGQPSAEVVMTGGARRRLVDERHPRRTVHHAPDLGERNRLGQVCEQRDRSQRGGVA